MDDESVKKVLNVKKKTFGETLQNKCFKLLLIGEGESGKTYFLKNHIFKYIQDEYKNVVFFTNKSNEGYKKTFFPCFLIVNNHMEKLEKMLDMINNAYVRDKKGNKIMNGDDYVRPSKTLLIFEDILNEKIIKTQQFQSLICYGRHSSISMIFIVQYPKVICSPLMRSNATHFVLFRMGDKNVQKTVCNIISESLSIYIIDDKKKDEESKKIYIEKVLKPKYGKLCIDKKNNLIFSYN